MRKKERQIAALEAKDVAANDKLREKNSQLSKIKEESAFQRHTRSRRWARRLSQAASTAPAPAPPRVRQRTMRLIVCLFSVMFVRVYAVHACAADLMFCKLSKCYATLALKDYSAEEILSCWYVPEEYRAIKDLNDKTVRRIECGKPPKKGGDCYRGLESFSKKGCRVFIRNLEQAIDAVLNKQDAQWEEEDCTQSYAHHHWTKTPNLRRQQSVRRSNSYLADANERLEQMASLYRGACSKSRMVALTMGIRDEREAWGKGQPAYCCKQKKKENSSKKQKNGKEFKIKRLLVEDVTKTETVTSYNTLSPSSVVTVASTLFRRLTVCANFGAGACRLQNQYQKLANWRLLPQQGQAWMTIGSPWPGT